MQWENYPAAFFVYFYPEPNYSKMKKRHEQKLLILSLGLFFVFNVPFLLAYNINDAIFGVPVFFFSIFGFWLFSVGLSWYVLKKHYE